MTVYGPATGHYSRDSISAARRSGGSKGTRILKVDSNGKAPSDAKVGDYVVTAGGTYQITGGTPGNWTSAKQGTAGYGSISDDSTANVRNAITSSKSNTSNLNSMIEQMYDEQTKSQLAQLKAAIQKGIAEQQTVIDNAPEQYQLLKNQSETQRYDNLRTVLEQSANAGDRGGIGRQNALETQAQADNRLNSLNLQQQNVIDTANQAIADLNSSQSTSEVQIKADNNLAKLKALIEQSQSDAKQQREDALNSIGAYSNDYQAQINKLTSDGDSSNDWLIPYLQSARNEKITNQAAAQAEADQQAFENWLKQRQIDYQTSKPYYKPSSSSGGLTFSEALKAYQSGIETDEVLKALGLK